MQRYRNIPDLPIEISKIVFKYDYFITGKRKLIFRDENNEYDILNAFLLSNNKLLYSFIDGSFKLLDLHTNTIQLSATTDIEMTNACSLLDGRFATTSLYRTIKIWNLDTEPEQILTLNSRVGFMGVLPDGRIVFKLNNDTIVNIWNINTSKPQILTTIDMDDTISLCNEYLIIANSKTITFYNVLNEKSFSINNRLSRDVLHQCYTALPNNCIAFNITPHRIQIWNLRTQIKVDDFTLNEMNAIHLIVLLPNNNLLIKGLHEKIIIWNPETSRVEIEFPSQHKMILFIGVSLGKIIFIEANSIYTLS